MSEPATNESQRRERSSPRVLLVINVPEPDAQTRSEIEAGRQPRRDFDELSRVLEADVLFLDVAAGTRLARVARRVVGERISKRVALAHEAFKRRHGYDIVFTDTDAVGLPFALFLKLAKVSPRTLRHVTLTHNLAKRSHLSAKAKLLLFRLGIASHIDLMIVHSSAQRALAVDTFGMHPERVLRLPYQVDTAFWHPLQIDIPLATEDAAEQPPVIVIPGHERRDYPTLLAAIRDLAVDAQITTRAVTSEQRAMASRPEWPENLEFHEYDHASLRAIYARSRFVVVPLLPVDFQAGITVVLEAMAMGKAVVVSGIRGQTDVIRDPRGDLHKPADARAWSGFLDDDGELSATLGRLPTGYYVLPQDPQDLRKTIELLLGDPGQAASLGRNGREVAVAMFSIEAFAARFAAAILGDLRETETNAGEPSRSGRWGSTMSVW